ncbi:Adenosylcobinamide-GDP ribazoletransferase [compost metagenome]
MLLFGWCGLLAIGAALLTFFLMRRAFVTRLGGTTGDTAGALVEAGECVVLVILALATA